MTTASTQSTAVQNPVTVSLRICFPEAACDEPILSKLIAQHGLTVNVRAAMLGARADGWFDLDLSGDRSRVEEAIAALGEFDTNISFGPIVEGATSPVAALELTCTDETASDTPQESIDLRIWIRIPRELCDRPILSGLMARESLTVNILGALLQTDGRVDGRFDLHLSGPRDRIDEALNDLENLGIVVTREAGLPY